MSASVPASPAATPAPARRRMSICVPPSPTAVTSFSSLSRSISSSAVQPTTAGFNAGSAVFGGGSSAVPSFPALEQRGVRVESFLKQSLYGCVMLASKKDAMPPQANNSNANTSPRPRFGFDNNTNMMDLGTPTANPPAGVKRALFPTQAAPLAVETAAPAEPALVCVKLSKLFLAHALKSPDASGRMCPVRDRVLAEAECLRKLVGCEHVAQLVDEITDAEHHYLVTSYAGRELFEVVQQQQGLPLATVKNYTAQLARGVASMHQQGIAHLDLSLTNCVVDANNRVRIIDLGVADAGEEANMMLPAAALTINAPVAASAPAPFNSAAPQAGSFLASPPPFVPVLSPLMTGARGGSFDALVHAGQPDPVAANANINFRFSHSASAASSARSSPYTFASPSSGGMMASSCSTSASMTNLYAAAGGAERAGGSSASPFSFSASSTSSFQHALSPPNCFSSPSRRGSISVLQNSRVAEEGLEDLAYCQGSMASDRPSSDRSNNGGGESPSALFLPRAALPSGANSFRQRSSQLMQDSMPPPSQPWGPQAQSQAPTRVLITPPKVHRHLFPVAGDGASVLSSSVSSFASTSILLGAASSSNSRSSSSSNCSSLPSVTSSSPCIGGYTWPSSVAPVPAKRMRTDVPPTKMHAQSPEQRRCARFHAQQQTSGSDDPSIPPQFPDAPAWSVFDSDMHSLGVIVYEMCTGRRWNAAELEAYTEPAVHAVAQATPAEGDQAMSLSTPIAGASPLPASCKAAVIPPPGVDAVAWDLIRACTAPEGQRISAARLLSHPFLQH